MLKRLMIPAIVLTAAAPTLAHPGHAHDESMSMMQVVLHTIMGVNPLLTLAAGVAIGAGLALAVRMRRRVS